MPYFTVEVSISIDSASIEVEADSFDDARLMVESGRYDIDDFNVSGAVDAYPDWVSCDDCGGEDEHDDECEHADHDVLAELGL